MKMLFLFVIVKFFIWGIGLTQVDTTYSILKWRSIQAHWKPSISDLPLKCLAWIHNLSSLSYQRELLPSEELRLPHLVASLLKRWLLGTYQGAVKSSHLVYYLDEFTFRFHRRTSRKRDMLFYRLVQQAIMVDPVSENELKSKFPSKENFDDLEI